MDSLDHGTLHKAKARTLDTSKRTIFTKILYLPMALLVSDKKMFNKATKHITKQ